VAPAALASCEDCYVLEVLEGGVTRLRVNGHESRLRAGGLRLSAQSRRRARWDIYVPTLAERARGAGG
jgi:hypothetical protein